MAAAAKILVVGAGATGACVALRLRQLCGQAAHVTVWEKARGPGGRMSTNRQDLAKGRLRADMGAQYVSLDCSDPACAEVLEFLVGSGVCEEVPGSLLSETPQRRKGDSWRHLAGTKGGVSDALRKLLDESGAEVQYKRRVASIDESGGRWRVSPFKAAAEVYDAVVVAVPGRGVGGDNLQKIKGDWDQKLTADQSRKLRTVKHDARWSIALFLAPQARSNCDAFFGGSAIERVLDDGVLHLLSYQSRKTAQIGGVSSPEAGCVVVAHTACEWAQANIRANGRDRRLVAEISQHVTGLLGLKGPLSKHVLASKVITWKQCQVAVTYAPAQKQVNCLLVSGDPPLLLAGDYFTESSFAGCLKSGFSAAEALAEQFAGVVANSSC